MGRMADARKRAKRGAVSPAEEPKPEQAEREPPASEPAFADDAVFADDPEAGSVLHGEQQQLRADRDSLPGSERGVRGVRRSTHRNKCRCRPRGWPKTS